MVAALTALVVVWGAATIWAVRSAWGAVNKVAAVPSPGQPQGEGRNVLLVGSDSRAGLSKAEQDRLGTGYTEGARTDSIMVLHRGSGDPTLLSIPRDSYVEIPGYGPNKINAAYALGGAKLLAETIEYNTDLPIDGYMEIGFGGFAGVVDAVGGVRICVKQDMNDPQAHVNLRKGCQNLGGSDALGYVRSRYANNSGDLGRAQRQREFLGALMGKIATPTTVLQPWRIRALGKSSGAALTVDEEDSMWDTGRDFLALRSVSSGGGVSLTVPVATENLATSAGTAVQWDREESRALFDRLREDQPVTPPPAQ